MTFGVSQETQAQAAIMQQTAQKFEQVNESLQTMLNNLMGELEGLRQSWQGAGGRSFEQVKQQWSEDQKSIQRALSETASAIRTSGQQYDATDSEASSRFNHTNSGVSLPL